MEKKIITIMGAEAKTYKRKDGSGEFTIMNIKDEKGLKYQFFTVKKDGTDTKAYMGFKSGNLGVGKQVGVAYNEEPASFTNNEGKKIDFVRRNIAFFGSAEEMEQFNYVDTDNKEDAPPPAEEFPSF